eukprot:TRINITY_DN1343_c5_g1_i1.p1 TRINITY_DN1343_c5_g1~~TRINITY_DN1343_c5_g1_i1.p1  ORF type:complete len:325 (+),score=58.34 TRINITY_DN1343_c5_g1_i1:49-1023(+)
MSEGDKKRVIRVGSRKSPLAMVQTKYVIAQLKEKRPDLDYEILETETKGDKILDKPLVAIGDKGLFTQELENQMYSKEIDFAVHSCKDLQTSLPEGLRIGAFMKRHAKEDVFIAKKGSEAKSLNDLPPGSVIGTSSLRRRAVLAHHHPGLKFKDIRGNIGTRLNKLDDDENGYDGTILAKAGLERMNEEKYGSRVTQVLSEDKYMYAVAQGILAIECREGDEFILSLLSEIGDELTTHVAKAERALLRGLEGGCHVPIAVRSVTSETDITLFGAVYSLDGKQNVSLSGTAPLEESAQLGASLSKQLATGGAREILDNLHAANKQ